MTRVSNKNFFKRISSIINSRNEAEIKEENMDIAVLSDIHGNYVALKRCLKYAFSRILVHFYFWVIILVN